MPKFLSVLVFLPIFLFADQIVSREGDIVTVVASGEYIMGDSDSRKESRNMALAQAKTNASEVAGTYIESNFESITQQINGENVDKVTKKELRSFSAAILQNEITNENLELLANQTTVYKISIKAKIDLSTLRERVKQIGEDKAKKDQIADLEKKNKELASTIEKLSQQMKVLENSKMVKTDELKALRDEREELFTKIEKNEGAVKLVFEKGSISNEYQERKDKVNYIVSVINDAMKKHLSKYVKISIEKPKIIEEKNNIYILEFETSWAFDMKGFKAFLDSKDVKVYFDNRGDTGRMLIDNEYYQVIYDLLLQQMSEYRACIMFRFPNEKIQIPLFENGSNIFTLSNHPRDTIQFTLTKKQLENFSDVNAIIETEIGNESSDFSGECGLAEFWGRG